MGNSESNASVKALHANYQMIRIIKENSRYGEGKVVRQKSNNQEAFQKEINLTDEEKFNKIKIQLEKKQVNPQNNLINVIKLYYHEDNQFCGQFYKIYVLLEYVPSSLYDNFEQKLAKKQYFNESQLWLILIGCIEAFSTLQQSNITHQCIRPDTISYLEESPYIKITDTQITGVLSSFQQLLQDEMKPTNLYYLSPQLMGSLNDENDPLFNPYKSDVYSLGMVMLHASTLISCEDCYDYQRYKVLHQQVQRRITQLEQSFSSQYIQVLRTMLLLNEEQRPDFLQLKNELNSMSPPGSPQQIKNEYEDEVIVQTKYSQQVQPQPVQQQYEQTIQSFSIQQSQPQIILNSPPPDFSAKFNSQVQKSQSIRQSQQFQTNQSLYLQQPGGLRELRADICDHLKILTISDQPSDQSQTDNNQGNQIGVEELTHSHHDNLMPVTSFETSQQYQQYQLKNSRNNQPISYDSYKVEYTGHSQKKTNQYEIQNYQQTSKYDYLYDKQLSNQEKLNNYQNDLKRNFESQVQSNNPELVTEMYPNGSRYEGEKVNGLRHGQGTFFYSDNGGVYEGQWFENKMHGQGTLFYASGKPAYEGQWVDDKFQGKGTLYNEEPQALYGEFDYKDYDQIGEFWTKYVGQFHEDNKEGFGNLYLSNGERFEGNFLQDLMSGPGKHFKKNGQVISGRWWRNKLQQ